MQTISTAKPEHLYRFLFERAQFFRHRLESSHDRMLMVPHDEGVAALRVRDDRALPDLSNLRSAIDPKRPIVAVAGLSKQGSRLFVACYISGEIRVIVQCGDTIRIVDEGDYRKEIVESLCLVELGITKASMTNFHYLAHPNLSFQDMLFVQQDLADIGIPNTTFTIRDNNLAIEGRCSRDDIVRINGLARLWASHLFSTQKTAFSKQNTIGLLRVCLVLLYADPSIRNSRMRGGDLTRLALPLLGENEDLINICRKIDGSVLSVDLANKIQSVKYILSWPTAQ